MHQIVPEYPSKPVTREYGIDGKPARFKPEDMPIEAVVGPMGEIVHHRPRGNGGGSSVVKWDPENEVLYIPKRHKADGWKFYKDVCAGNYVDPDGSDPIAAPEFYAKWRAAVGEIAEGWEGAPTPVDFYHPFVQKLRDLRRGQNKAKPDSVFDHASKDAATEALKAKAKKRAKKAKATDGEG